MIFDTFRVLLIITILFCLSTAWCWQTGIGVIE